MTIVKHEFRQGGKSLAVWTAVIGFFIAVCVFLYPEMASEMEGVSDLFSSMGAFTAAFGMDRLNFGTLIGFYAVECGNILGIGGALFASLSAASLLSREEGSHTAEFLLTHPISRTQVVFGKLAALLLQTLLLNAVVFAMAVGAVAAIGYEIPWKDLALLHGSCLLVQLELEGLCFCVSAFLRRSGASIGMGIAVGMYFLNILANLSDSAASLKYITPFAFAEGADILTDGKLDLGLVSIGMAVTVVSVLCAWLQYRRKDIH